MRQQHETQRVGVREFRENLSSYIEGSNPIAVTRHGATVGYYIPTKPAPQQQELDALAVASEKMQALLKEMNVSEDELVAEFETMRKKGRQNKKR